MTDITAAIGLVQLDRYPGMLARRRQIIEKYDAAMDEMGIHHLTHYGEDFAGSGHLYIINIPDIDAAIRNRIIMKMAEKGVACNVHYKPLPMMTAYKKLGWSISSFPNAYRHYLNEITLPLHTLLSDEDVDYVIETLRETVKNSEKL
jgi:dTDP-4-amino-4,6-dideoxygalactose transaminase